MVDFEGLDIARVYKFLGPVLHFELARKSKVREHYPWKRPPVSPRGKPSISKDGEGGRFGI